MAMSTGGAEGEPMMDVNTTPLIDVMLVLLIMFIITIPIQTHAVKLDLPVDTGDMTPPPIDPVKNKIVVEPNGTILWNGAPVDPVTLRQYLDITTRSEEHTSELQSLMRLSYAVFCLKKQKKLNSN